MANIRLIRLVRPTDTNPNPPEYNPANPADSTTAKFTFLVKNTDTAIFDAQTPVSPLPLPQKADDDNVLVKVEGNTTVITLTFIMNDQPTSLVTGAYSSVRTAIEQMKFMTEAFPPTDIRDKYRFAILGSATQPNNDLIEQYFKLGTISDVSCVVTGMEPVTFRCTVQFMVGNVIAAGYNRNVPNKPTGLLATDTSAPTVGLSWTAPTNILGAGSITGYKIDKQLGELGTRVVVATTVGSGTTFTDPNVGGVLGDRLFYRVTGKNDIGFGEVSDTLQVVLT